MRIERVRRLEGEHSVARLCQVLEISASPQVRVGSGGVSWMPPQVRKSIEMRA